MPPRRTYTVRGTTPVNDDDAPVRLLRAAARRWCTAQGLILKAFSQPRRSGRSEAACWSSTASCRACIGPHGWRFRMVRQDANWQLECAEFGECTVPRCRRAASSGAGGKPPMNEMQRALCSSIIDRHERNGSTVTVGSLIAELMRQGHDVPPQDVRQILKHRQKKQKKHVQGPLQNVAAAQSFLLERNNWQSGELYVAHLEASSKLFSWVGLCIPFFKALVPLCESGSSLPLGFFFYAIFFCAGQKLFLFSHLWHSSSGFAWSSAGQHHALDSVTVCFWLCFVAVHTPVKIWFPRRAYTDTTYQLEHLGYTFVLLSFCVWRCLHVSKTGVRWMRTTWPVLVSCFANETKRSYAKSFRASAELWPVFAMKHEATSWSHAHPIISLARSKWGPPVQQFLAWHGHWIWVLMLLFPHLSCFPS